MLYSTKYANSYVRCWKCRRIAELNMMTCSGSTILLKLGGKALLNKLRNLSLSPSLERGPWEFWCWPRVVGLLKLASGCLRAQIRKSNEQQQLYKESWESVLAMKRLWRIKCVYSARVQYLIASSLRQGLVHRHLIAGQCRWWSICPAYSSRINAFLNRRLLLDFTLCTFLVVYIQGGARNVIPLIVHITHFYCYKSIWHLV